MNPFFEQIASQIYPDVERFLTKVIETYPTIKGQVGDYSVGDIKLGENNKASITELYRCLEIEHPEAGQPYWSIRIWSMLVRQPIYLALVGVHQLKLAPPLDTISQILRDGQITGFSLPNIRFQQINDNELVNSTGQRLKEIIDALFEELSAITRLRRVSAMRLVADTLLAGLNQMKYTRSHIANEQLTNSQIIDLSSQWLCAMDLQAHSSLKPITLSSGKEQLVLNRKGCCMHYRRKDGGLCASCPKQKLPERLERLRNVYEAKEENIARMN